MKTFTNQLPSKTVNFAVLVSRWYSNKSSQRLRKKDIYGFREEEKDDPLRIDLECEHITRILKSKNDAENCPKNKSTEVDTFCNGYRVNELNIQMLSKQLYDQIYGQDAKNTEPEAKIIKQAQEELRKLGLWTEKIDFLKDVSLTLPPLEGKNIEQHFQYIAEEQSGPYRKILNTFIKCGLPQQPENWLLQKGWTKYVAGKNPESVPFPDDEALILDVEVCMKLGELPTLATAVSGNAWYGWVSSNLASGADPVPMDHYKTDFLIPFEGRTIGKKTPRIIVGHNVSYDRARVKEQYYIKNSALRFFDTMSLHICIGGFSRHQKNELKEKIDDDFETWKSYSCLSSLKDVYSIYCNKELSKEKRNTFVSGTLTDIRKDFQSLMKYCSNDVKATYEILQAIFPIFLKRFPHPVTLAGMLEMSTAFLPVNDNWKRYLADADQTYDDLRNEISMLLSRKSDDACSLLHNEEFKNDMWMWSEDWTLQELKFKKNKHLNDEFEHLKDKKDKKEVIRLNEEKKILSEKTTYLLSEESEDEELLTLTEKFQYLFDLEHFLYKKKPFLPGYPLWYRKLCEKSDSLDWVPNPQLNTSLMITPLLLNLTWENFPLHHTREHGWGILVADINAENVKTSLPFEKLKELTLRNCKHLITEDIYALKTTKKSTGNSPVSYYTGSGVWCNHVIDDCCYFFKLPHKFGNSKNVGNPLGKDFSNIYANNILAGSDYVAKKVLNLSQQLTYWRNNRERIMSQFVVWLNRKDCLVDDLNENINIGVILPKVVVCGTLTRRAMEPTWLTASKTVKNRIGSELRSMVQAPPGYHIVGADVDSQELWIASLIGDSCFAKLHGSTPFGWMTLSGTKANMTDLHSVTAKATGISREQAKVINYARIYGAGISFAKKLLQQFNPSMSADEASAKAQKMYTMTKGKKFYKIKKNMIPKMKKDFGPSLKVYDLATAHRIANFEKKKIGDIFEEAYWKDGTESAMFNELEKIANSRKPVTPFLQCRLSRALEPRFEGDNFHSNTRINWVVQSGAVDFLHLMLVCMRWLTNGRARYCFSFHDEVRFLIPSEERYNCALAIHLTNLFVRSFCASRLGMYDLPQSVAFFSSVEVDKTLRKEANDDCITPSNPHGMEKGYGIALGETLDIYQTIEKSGGSLLPFGRRNNQVHAEA